MLYLTLGWQIGENYFGDAGESGPQGALISSTLASHSIAKLYKRELCLPIVLLSTGVSSNCEVIDL